MIVFLVAYLSVFSLFNFGKNALTINDKLSAIHIFDLRLISGCEYLSEI